MLLNFIALFLTIGYTHASPTVTPRQAKGNSTCDAQKVTQLIGGIQENMFIQKQELQGLQTLQTLSTLNTPLAPPANGTQSDFQLNQLSITMTQLKAIAVRERNQKLADELNSPSAKGLAIVAQSQVAVMIDMKSLKGGGEGDEKMLGELVMRVKDAMAQNGENLKIADMGCGR